MRTTEFKLKKKDLGKIYKEIKHCCRENDWETMLDLLFMLGGYYKYFSYRGQRYRDKKARTLAKIAYNMFVLTKYKLFPKLLVSQKTGMEVSEE